MKNTECVLSRTESAREQKKCASAQSEHRIPWTHRRAFFHPFRIFRDDIQWAESPEAVGNNNIGARLSTILTECEHTIEKRWNKWECAPRDFGICWAFLISLRSLSSFYSRLARGYERDAKNVENDLWLRVRAFFASFFIAGDKQTIVSRHRALSSSFAHCNRVLVTANNNTAER